MWILGKFWADVRVQKVVWSRDRWSDFRKLGIKRCVRLERKKSRKGVSRSAAVADFVQGGSKIGLKPSTVYDEWVSGIETSISMLIPYHLSICCLAECKWGRFNGPANTAWGPFQILNCALAHGTCPISILQTSLWDRDLGSELCRTLRLHCLLC